MLTKIKENLSLNNLILVTIAASAFFLILPFSVPVSSTLGSVIVFALLAAIMFSFALRLKEKSFYPLKSSLFFAPVIFAFVAILSALFNPPLMYSVFGAVGSFDSLAFLLIVISLYIFASTLMERPFYDKLIKALQFVYLAGFAFILVSLVLNLLNFKVAGFFRFGFASVLEFSLFAAFVFFTSLLQSAESRREKAIKYLSLIASFVALVFINSYVAWISILTSTALAIYFVAKGKLKTNKISLYIAALLALIFLLFGLQISFYLKAYSQVSVAQDARPTLLGSLLIAQNAYSDSVKNKLIGTGPASYPFDWFAYKSNDYASAGAFWNRAFDKAYNSVLHFATVFGVLGLLSWLFVIFSVFVYLFRFAFSATYKRVMNLQISKSYLALFFVSVAFLFYSPGAFGFLLFFVLMLNFVLALKERSLVKELILSLPPFAEKLNMPKFKAIFAGILSAYIALSLVLIFVISLLKLGAGSDLNKHEVYNKIAYYTLPSRAEVHESFAEIASARLYAELQKQDKEDSGARADFNKLVHLDDYVRHLEKARDAEPRNFARHLALARAYALKYSFTKDEADYKKAELSVADSARFAPRHPSVLFVLSQILATKGDKEASRQALLQALALKPDFKDAYNALFGMALEQKNFEEAVALAQLEVRNNPNDYFAWRRLAVALLNNKQYKEAAATAQSILGRYPSGAKLDIELLQVLLISLKEQGKDKEALEILQKLSEKFKDAGLNRMLDAIKKQSADSSAEGSIDDDQEASDEKSQE